MRRMEKNRRAAIAVTAGCTLMLLVTGGVVMNVYSAAQPYILVQNGFSNTQTSLIITIRSAFYLASMAVIGGFYKKLGYRAGCAASTLLAAVSFVMFAAAGSLAAYYAAGAAAGLSCGLGSMVPASILIHRWFRSHRGLALGICAAGTGLATVALSPLLTKLIETQGLKAGFLWTAGFCALSAAAALLLIRNNPEEAGLAPVGRGTAESPQEKALHGIRMSRARQALLVTAVALVSGICSTGFAHVMTLYVTAGMDAMRAASALSVCGLALMLGKCVCGELCDRMGTYRANRIVFGILIGGCALCTLAPGKNVWGMYAAAACLGFGVSLNTVGVTIWASDLSTHETYDRTLRLFESAYGAGCLAMSFVPGVVADATGSYAPAYALFGGVLGACLLVLQSTYRLARKKK